MAEVVFSAEMEPWLAELARLQVPSYRTIEALEVALHHAFEQTQADVHVVTGSLRGSGRTNTDFQNGVWEGSIVYGGESPGFPHNPVLYADYELARGGDHDFLRNANIIDAEILAAMVGFFDGDL